MAMCMRKRQRDEIRLLLAPQLPPHKIEKRTRRKFNKDSSDVCLMSSIHRSMTPHWNLFSVNYINFPFDITGRPHHRRRDVIRLGNYSWMQQRYINESHLDAD